MHIKKLTDINIVKKRVLIREDLNVPLENGHITSDQRIRAALPALQYALKQQAAVIVMSHLGRPADGEYDPALSLAPVAKCLSELLHKSVPLIKEWQSGIIVKPGEIVLLENIRFNKGERNNDVTLSKKLAALCDVFVMDAFATAHRTEASTCGVAEYASIACAGPLLMAELEALSRAFYQPKKPLVAIVGGSKVSTKLTVLESLLQKVDQLIVGGGIVNTFLKAQGFNIGKSLCEMELIDTAKRLQQLAKERDAAIPMPVDVVVAKEFSKTARATIKSVEIVADDEMILDIGPKTARQFADYLKNAGTIVWNGPVGVFEWDQFGEGTKTLAQAIAHSSAFSLAGGGDTLVAIDKYNIQKQLSYISTGGGAFLEFLEGKELPAVAVLQRRNSSC